MINTRKAKATSYYNSKLTYLFTENKNFACFAFKKSSNHFKNYLFSHYFTVIAIAIKVVIKVVIKVSSLLIFNSCLIQNINWDFSFTSFCLKSLNALEYTDVSNRS